MIYLRSLALLLVCVPALQAQERVIGLLSLPEAFGGGPCERFIARDITLYAAPDTLRQVGTIRVDRHWTFPQEGGCEGLRVGVHLTNPSRDSELPTEEYDYEAPGVIVLETGGKLPRAGGWPPAQWFKVRLTDGTAWVLRESGKSEFFPLQRLLENYPTHLTDAFDGRLAASPGGPLSTRSDSLAGRPVNLGGFRDVAGQLWIQVEVVSWSLCESEDKPVVLARGWLPAHVPSGKPSIWFSSRGC